MTRKGEEKESWIVDYTDQHGERHIETFAKKKDADAHHATVKVDVRKGVHTAASKSITVGQAAENWLKYIELEGREAATILGIQDSRQSTYRAPHGPRETGEVDHSAHQQIPR